MTCSLRAPQQPQMMQGAFAAQSHRCEVSVMKTTTYAPESHERRDAEELDAVGGLIDGNNLPATSLWRLRAALRLPPNKRMR